MDAQPRAAITAAIRATGPIGFDRFMELALYEDGGFYVDPPIGVDEGRAFATSPHVHPVFGQLLAAGILELWDGLGRPEPFVLTEVGAGDGTLAGRLIEALAEIPLTYVAVERSPGAQDALRQVSGVRLAEQPSGAHVVLGHELLDNLPFRRVRMTTDGPREIRVGLETERFVEVLADLDPGLLTPAQRSFAEPGDETVVPVGAFRFIDELAAGSPAEGMYAVLIDYGAEGHPGGPVHGYAGHRLVEDVLADPGSSDITVGVDFSLLADHARAAGLIATPSRTQRQILTALGFERWTREELARQTTFLDERKGIEAVRAWSGRQSASLLVDPAGLGRLRWMLLATPGLAIPSWMADDSV